MKTCAVCDLCFDDSEETCHGQLVQGPYSVDAIPGYRIERLMSSTSKSKTYQARHLEYGQECFVIIVDGSSESFLADAKVAAGLFNSSVAAVVEYGELASGSAYAVLEGFGGRTPLSDLIADGSLSLLDQVRIARQTGEAVHSLHAAGLTHGAIRPSNVSVTGAGSDEISVKLHNIDLGGAIANSVLSNRLAMDSAVDLIRYMAPERFGVEHVTKRSDVYCLGLLLYELLSGHPPFEEDSAAALIDLHLNHKAPEVKIENFDLRMLLTHTLFESLQKQPSFRQSTADLFARQLRHIEQLATHVSTPPPAVIFERARAVATPVVMDVVAPIARPVELPRPEKVTVMVRHEAPVDARIARPVAEPKLTPVAPPIIETARETEIHDVPVTEPIPLVPAATKRSRLKGMKRRLHSHIADAKTALRGTPRLIEWDQPDNDMPLVDEVPTIAKEVAVQLAPPTPIQWEQPDDDVPSIDAVREELAGSGMDVPFASDEEITHVRPPADRIEVAWTSPLPVRKSELAEEYFPSFLEQHRPSHENVEFQRDSMFAAYDPARRDLGKLPIYGVAVAALVVLGFGAYQLGSALSDDSEGYIGESRPARVELPAAPVRNDPIAPQQAVMNIPAQTVTIPQPMASATVSDEADTKKRDEIEPVKISASRRSDEERSKPAGVNVRRISNEENPIVPSTLVITRSAGRPKTVVVSDAPRRESQPVKKSSGATRPRIVSLPD